MRRRSFFAVLFLFLAGGFAGLAASSGDGTIGISYGVVSAGHLGLAAYYRFHPEPMGDPDAAVPRRWFELAAVAVVSLLVGVGGFALVAGVL